VVLVLIVLFAGISGVNDGGNLVGTFLPTRLVPPLVMIPSLIVSIFVGPLVFGTRVSHTIAIEILNFQAAGMGVLAVALLAALLTLVVTWWLRLPSSATVALAGGMVGAALLDGDGGLIHWGGVLKVAVGLIGSVVIGFLAAYILTWALWRVLTGASQETARRLSYLQFLAVVLQGLAYGANDQEKAIGLMALFLMLVNHDPSYHVTVLALVVPLLAWAGGLLVGGLRIAQTVGGHVFRLRPMHALATETAAAATVIGAALTGVPVSTTQTTDGSLFGLGTALAPRRVQWRTLGRMVGVWLWTMPLAVAFGTAVMALVRLS
jgi:PiT family inorganic phosphate transporter